MKVTVTRELVLSGVAASCQDCALAKALQDMFPGKTVEVFPVSAKIDGVWYNLSHEAAAFIIAFDTGCASRYTYPLELELREIPFSSP